MTEIEKIENLVAVVENGNVSDKDAATMKAMLCVSVTTEVDNELAELERSRDAMFSRGFARYSIEDMVGVCERIQRLHEQMAAVKKQQGFLFAESEKPEA